MLGTYALSAGYYDAYYLKAQKVRTLIKADFDQAFEKVDALVAPTSPTVAFKFGARLQDPVAMYLSDACTLPGQRGRPARAIGAVRLVGWLARRSSVHRQALGRSDPVRAGPGVRGDNARRRLAEHRTARPRTARRRQHAVRTGPCRSDARRLICYSRRVSFNVPAWMAKNFTCM